MPKKSDSTDNQDLFEEQRGLQPIASIPLATPTLDEAMAALRTKEAGLVLSWLNANGCLAFGSLPKALAGIEAGEHR